MPCPECGHIAQSAAQSLAEACAFRLVGDKGVVVSLGVNSAECSRAELRAYARNIEAALRHAGVQPSSWWAGQEKGEDVFLIWGYDAGWARHDDTEENRAEDRAIIVVALLEAQYRLERGRQAVDEDMPWRATRPQEDTPRNAAYHRALRGEEQR